jgi:hypothetical protein
MKPTTLRVAGIASALAASLVSVTVAGTSGAVTRGGVGRVAPASRPANVQSARTNISSGNRNVNANVNRNANVNVNRNVNVNQNVNVHGGGYRGGYYGGYNGWGHPIATAAAVTATAVAVGTVASTLPPSGCSAISVGGVSYQRCGPNYYQPVYQGGGVQYVVVNPPQ